MRPYLGFVTLLVVAACSAVGTPPVGNGPETVAEKLLSGALPYRGVSLASAEFAVDPNGNGTLPGVHGKDYVYPDPHYASGYNSADYYVQKGMTTFRLPFRWERLQPTRNAAFDVAEQTRLTTTVDDLLAKGVVVFLDPHNYARYGTALIGSNAVPNSDFADFWRRLASLYKGNSRVVFAIMNEPHDMSTEQWVGAANAAIAAIRSVGATNLIVVPGNGWDGAYGWSQNWYGTANAAAMLQITDPGNNYAFEVHQYLDPDSSGSGSTCVSTTIGSERLAGFTSWLHVHGKRGFLGEFSGAANSTCLAAIDDMLNHIEANSNVWLGWTFWAAGPWWGPGSIEPTGGADEARVKALLPHLAWAGGTPPPPPSPPPPPPGTCAATTYDAATMIHSTGGATAGGWDIWTNGYIATNHTFAAGATTITVFAKGDVAANVWPHMIVSVGGTNVGEASVSTASWVPYPFTFTGAAGSTEIRVAFDNDYVGGGQDRNLLVQKLTVDCPSAQYDFETGTQSWATNAGSMITGTAGSTVRAVTGTHSLAVSFNGSGASTQSVSVGAPATPAGAVVTFNIWIPAGSAVSGVQPYVLQGAGGGWIWTGNFQPMTALQAGAWNRLAVTVPRNAATPLYQLGVELTTNAAWSGTVYIDAVGWP